MATQVAVITAATGAQAFYSTYAAARTAAAAGDKIQIWADLSDEQILLKNGVDVWIAPGRIIDMSLNMPTVKDEGNVECSIFGYGIIKNSYTHVTDARYECIKISNGSSKVFIECDSIEGTGGAITESNAYNGACINVSIKDQQSFQLICNQIKNDYNSAVVFENLSDTLYQNSINIRANRIETGLADVLNSGNHALVLGGTGFVSVDEIVCNNNSSCLIHEGGNITANILKQSTLNSNTNSTTYSPTVKVFKFGEADTLLKLYFDEIQNLNGGDAIEAETSTINLIGRRIFSTDGLSMDLSSDANILADEIISETKGINIHNDSTTKIVIDSNKIEGSNGNDGVIRSSTGSNYVVRNAKIKNNSTSSPSVGIYIPNGNVDDQNIEVENIIIVTGIGMTDFSILRDSDNNIHIKNLLLFVKKAVSEKVLFEIGDLNNFKYIENSDIA